MSEIVKVISLMFCQSVHDREVGSVGKMEAMVLQVCHSKSKESLRRVLHNGRDKLQKCGVREDTALAQVDSSVYDMIGQQLLPCGGARRLTPPQSEAQC